MAICSLRQLGSCLVFCVRKSFPFEINYCEVTNYVSLSGNIIYCTSVLLHSGGLAERLNRLQCRQRSAISFWRHQSISGTSAATAGDSHKPTVLSTITLPFTSESPLMLNNELWFVSGMKPVCKWAWFFFSLFVIVRRGHTEEVLAVAWSLYFWTVNSVYRWQETACLGLFFFFFPWCTKPLVLSRCKISPYNRTKAVA